MCASVSFSLAKNASREETHASGRFLAGRGVFFDRSVVVGITLCHPVSKKRLRLLEVFFWKKKNELTYWWLYMLIDVIFYEYGNI